MSQDQEEDYTKLSLEARITHKVWKARLGAYEELSKNFSLSGSPTDPCFDLWARQPDLWRSVLADSNVAAQGAGVTAFVSFCKFSDPSYIVKCRELAAAAISEKCLTSRASTKSDAVEALMLMVEVDTANPVIDALLSSLSARSPKVITANVSAIADLVEQFGTKIIQPKPIVAQLKSMFGHADKNVRQETFRLTVNLFRWIGEPLKLSIFGELKPVQVKELESSFSKLPTDPPKQQRLLRSQVSEQTETAEDNEKGNGGEINEEPNLQEEEDELDLIEEVDVIPKIDPNLETVMSSTKWKERKEALDALVPVLSQPRIKEGDFFGLVALLSKSIVKDANVMVVMNAANCITVLAKGLRSNYSKYAITSVQALLERSKEKKQNVVETLSSAMDAACDTIPFNDVSEPICAFSNNKNPQIKIACFTLLTRCFRKVPQYPSKSSVELCAKSCVPGVSDTFEPVRSSAAEALGTLMKLVGERQLAIHMESLDEIRKSKIMSFFESAIVKAKAPSKTKPAPTAPIKKSDTKPGSPPKLETAKNPPLSTSSASTVSASPKKKTNNEKLSLNMEKSNAFENGPLMPRPTTRPVARGLSRNSPLLNKPALKSTSPLPAGTINQTVQGIKNMELDDAAHQPTKHSKTSPSHLELKENNGGSFEEIASLNEENEELKILLSLEREEKTRLQRELAEVKKELSTIRDLQPSSPLNDRRSAFLRRANSEMLDASTGPSNRIDLLQSPLGRARPLSSTGFTQHSPLALSKSGNNFSFQKDPPKQPFSPRSNTNAEWSKAIDLTTRLKQKITEMKQTDIRHQGTIH
ncbi:TOG/XMAP215 microtubule plus end tracking polymerase Alp14 [Schizosaccharomyces osmophilus]|uniref:TOG/XMAP215 microtubule plus end tracking polymerase Alp14 n=1 Tax=Schizosaccharomyces osmophilus TaxID=2545709 RepID=A0AAE9WE40_9SCHI|nr:TOG/XMAP215 microtubule plus end tracking polymerase Alp14 [Schizosaccharomyces osmophilus]WBW74550.1 TOG/XMAP215 microtubule plus end tracking polymerase Alp14 [Schizosaccharomyces osmophilus]